MWTARVFTLYPELFPGPLGSGLYKKALDKKLWSLEVINIRDYALDKHKTVIFPLVPTAENMALVAMDELKTAFAKEFKLSIKPIKVRLYETPNNWADAY